MLVVAKFIPHIDTYKYETGNTYGQAGKVDECINRFSFRSPVKNQKVAFSMYQDQL